MEQRLGVNPTRGFRPEPELWKEFQIACIRADITQQDALTEAIKLWIATREKKRAGSA